MSLAPETEILNDPKALLHVRVGMASPLWPLFAGAAVGGAAWWWMTRWTRPANLEAMLSAPVEAEAEPRGELVSLAAPVVEATEAVVEAAAEQAVEILDRAEAVAETVVEPVLEAALQPEAVTEPVLEPLVESPAEPEPVGGEAAPIAPVLQAAPVETPKATPKPKKKPAPKAD